jgi:prephenate dehydrogenase
MSPAILAIMVIMGAMRAQQIADLGNAHVTIVGLGMMGGSMALALRPHVRKLTGVDTNSETRRAALARGIVDDVVKDVRHVAGSPDEDVLILATPVRAIVEIVEQLPNWGAPGRLLLDLGSTKGKICAAMDALPERFAAIGGHPMCGKEESGLNAAQEDLYLGQTFILCRTKRTDEDAEGMALSLVEAIGARPHFLPAEDHDRFVALTSHLPYFLAALLMQQSSEAAAREEQLWKVSASGFRDASRLAGSDPLMLLDIVDTNRAELISVLRHHVSNVERLIDLIEGKKDDALRAWLRARKSDYAAYRRALRDRR